MPSEGHKTVCHITTVHPHNDVRILHRECTSLAESGYRVFLISPSDRKRCINNVVVVPLPEKKGRLFRMLILPWLALWKAVRCGAELYHYHDPELMPIGFLLRWVFFKKVVYDIHEPVSRQILNKQWIPVSLRSVCALAYRVAEKILTVGQQLIIVVEHYAEDYGGREIVIHNYPKLNQKPAEETSLRKKKQPPLLVYVGGVSIFRGAEIYIDLASQLRCGGYIFQMKIIGPCLPESYRATAARKIQAEGLENLVHVTGMLENHRAMNEVARAAVGLCLLQPMPYYKVSLATKILEYMMLGVPVVCSHFDCWKKYVADEGSGLMVDPLDIDQVVKACAYLLDNPEEAARMGRAGMRAVRQKYNWESESRRLIECYKGLLKN